ncbi:MAG: PH domain-containing protein [Chloroflexi bacterium]|nr:MAG: PH domain-containing protein [Chloroflexota bacterium]
MSTPSEAHARIKARIWQAIAQTDLDISQIDKEIVNALVDLTTEAALMELDEEIGKSWSQTRTAQNDLDEEEQLLWEGRPFLSLSTHYRITNERIRITHGLLGKDREDIELIRIQDIDFSQTLSERILKIGDITIHSHDSSHPKVTLNNVKDPERVHEILRRAILNARKRYNFSYREEM